MLYPIELLRHKLHREQSRGATDGVHVNQRNCICHAHSDCRINLLQTFQVQFARLATQATPETQEIVHFAMNPKTMQCKLHGRVLAIHT